MSDLLDALMPDSLGALDRLQPGLEVRRLMRLVSLKSVFKYVFEAMNDSNC